MSTQDIKDQAAKELGYVELYSGASELILNLRSKRCLDDLTDRCIELAQQSQSEYIEGLKAEIERLKGENEWISVEDRLPDKSQNVLLKRAKPFHLYELTGFQCGGIFYSNETALAFECVTYWKPLLKQP